MLYLSSPPILSFWCVELGPQVLPFFLQLTTSSLHTAERPQVFLPSQGVTGSQTNHNKPRFYSHNLLMTESEQWCSTSVQMTLWLAVLPAEDTQL